MNEEIEYLAELIRELNQKINALMKYLNLIEVKTPINKNFDKYIKSKKK